MPSFTQHERDAIREKLLTCGRTLFTRHGLKKTTIDELAACAGIAKGSFYTFFESKELLFLEILEEQEAIRSELLNAAAASRKKPAGAMKELLQQSKRFVESNELIQHLYDRDTFERLWRKIPTERINEHLMNDEAESREFFRKWQKEGKLRRIPAEVAIGIIRAYVLLIMQRELIGEDVYETVMDELARYIAHGMTTR
jgi:AcrR family transcriptional regulator